VQWTNKTVKISSIQIQKPGYPKETFQYAWQTWHGKRTIINWKRGMTNRKSKTKSIVTMT